MNNPTEKNINKGRTPKQPPVHDFYMPAMPPTELIQALARWVAKGYRRFKQRR